MKSALISSAALLVLTAALAAQDADAARLIPSDAAVVVRFESAHGMEELVHAFAPLAGEEAANFDLDEMLGDAKTRFLGSAAQEFELDPARPLYIAFSFDPAGGPNFVLVLPRQSDAPLQLSSESTPGAKAVQLGKYIGLSSSAEYAALATPNALLAQLHPGLVSAHVDLRTIIETFRPLIDTGLRQAEMAMDQMDVPTSGMDMGAVLEQYLAGVRAVLDSADALGFTLVRDGDALASRFDFRERSDHPLGLLLDGPTADISDLLGRVDPKSSALAGYTGKWTSMYLAFQDMLDNVMDMYPEPFRADLRALLAMQAEIDPLLAPGAVMGFDFGADGMRGSYVMRTEHPAELMSALEKAMHVFDHEGGLVHIGATTTQNFDGLEAHVVPLAFDGEAFVKMVASMRPDAPQDASQLESVQQMITSFYGRDLRVALAHDGKSVIVCLANDESRVRAYLARFSKPSEASTDLKDLARHLERGAPGFVYQIDVGRFMGQMFDAMSALMPGVPMPELADIEASFSMWGSKKEHTYSGGVDMSLAEFMELARHMQELEKK